MYRSTACCSRWRTRRSCSGIAGVRLGAITDVRRRTDAEWGETLETMIDRWCRDMGVPYLGRARIGHDADNMVVPFGVA